MAGSFGTNILSGNLNTNSHAINTSYTTVASHATTSAIWVATGNIINFTGAEIITDLPEAPRAGSSRICICAGAIVFTHAGNISVQGATTFTATVGDEVTITAITTTTFKITIKKADGTSIISGASTTWIIKTSAYNAVKDDGIFADTNGAAFIITLPAAGTIGDTIFINDVSGSFDTNNLTVDRNSHDINNVASDLVCSIKNATYKFVYSNATYGWIYTISRVDLTYE